jgi:hypothetical protein
MGLIHGVIYRTFAVTYFPTESATPPSRPPLQKSTRFMHYSIQLSTMPPKSCQNLRNSAERERSLLLAVSALKNQEICNIREAACIYNVPRSTLQD